MQTANTTKHSLGSTVGTFGMPTRATTLAGVGRIDYDQGYTSLLCLVGHKRTQLPKCPIAVSLSLRRPASPAPRPDVLEVFKPYRSLRAFGLGNDALGNHVVGSGLKPPLASADALQAAFGALGADGLQGSPSPAVAASDPFDLLAAVGFAVRVNGEVDDAQVDPQRPVNVNRIGIGNVTGRKEVELSVADRPDRFRRAGGPASAVAGRRRRTGSSGARPPSRSTPSARPGRRTGYGYRRQSSRAAGRSAVCAGRSL